MNLYSEVKKPLFLAKISLPLLKRKSQRDLDHNVYVTAGVGTTDPLTADTRPSSWALVCSHQHQQHPRKQHGQQHLTEEHTPD